MKPSELPLSIKIVLPLFLLILFFTLFIAFKDDSFNIENVTPSLAASEEWQVEKTTDLTAKNLISLFKEPFIYLDEGGQSLVFISQNHHYVLKFFKFNRFRPSFFVSLLPEIFPFKDYIKRHTLKREQKLKAAFTGYKLGYELFKQESGLLFVQLVALPKPYFVELIDQKGIKWRINLEKIPFVLQKKGEILSHELSRLLDQEDLPGVKKRLDQLQALYRSEFSKGLQDIDLGVMHNIGYADEALFHLDVGKFVSNEEMKEEANAKEELSIIADRVQKWIKINYPHSYNDLSSYIKKSWELSL